MPNIYLLIDGQQEGPYSEEQVRQSLDEGLIRSDLPAWREGMTDWEPVEGLVQPKEDPAAAQEGDPISRAHIPQEVEISVSSPAIGSRGSLANSPEARDRSKVYRYWAIAVAGIVGLIILGISIGIGIGLAASKNAPITQTKQVVAAVSPVFTAPPVVDNPPVTNSVAAASEHTPVAVAPAPDKSNLPNDPLDPNGNGLAAELEVFKRNPTHPSADLVAYLKANIKNIKEVETDQPNFVDKPFLIQGQIEVCSAYDYSYFHAEDTHYAFNIMQGSSSAHAYMERDVADGLRQALLSSDTPLNGLLLVKIDSAHYNPPELSLSLLLVDFSPPLPKN